MNRQNVEWTYKLKKKILFGILGLLAVCISAAMIFIVITLRSSLLHDNQIKTQELGDVIKSSLRSMMIKRDPHIMQETFDDMKKWNNSIVKAFVVDKNGRVAFSTERNEIGRILDRFSEASCKGCHQLTGTAPKEATIMIRSVREKVEKHETLHLMINEWLVKKLDKEKISDDGKKVYLPIKKGDAYLALIAFGRLDKPFNAQRLELLAVVSDFMSMAFENARLYSIAITDELTHLYTTRHFRHCIDRELSEFEKYGWKFTLLMHDIDNFKRVNDTYGHLTGDVVLKEVAQCMLHSLRDNDLVFRYGDEEFVVILPATDAKGGVLVAERIRKTIEDFIFDKGTNNLKITVSIGVSACPVNGNTAHALVASADRALYKAKETGKNKVVISQDPPPAL
jgi:diguanylate cyclase (GGDEF)-like protein